MRAGTYSESGHKFQVGATFSDLDDMTVRILGGGAESHCRYKPHYNLITIPVNLVGWE